LSEQLAQEFLKIKKKKEKKCFTLKLPAEENDHQESQVQKDRQRL
jgi:hypothetical protein